MLGIQGNCPPESEGCEACYVPCAHSDEVRRLYAQQSGTVGAVKVVIDAFLQQQEEFLEAMCESRPALKGLAEAAGVNSCIPEMIEGEAITVCGEAKACYEPDCEECQDVTFDDAFYIAAIKTARESFQPTGDGVRAFFSFFGWDVTYTPEYIYIEGDPQKIQAVLHLAPRPIGVDFKIIT